MKILLLAIRPLMRFRTYTIINIAGLALSLACVIILCRYIHREITTDHFVKALDRVYFVALDRDNDAHPFISSQSRLLPDLTTEASVEICSFYASLPQDQISYDNKKFSANLLAVDSNYLKIITYPILKANRTSSLLTQPNEAVLTKEFAQKIFGEANPIGQTITHSSGNIATVTGILDQPETQISYPFDLLVSERLQENWEKVNTQLIRLKPHTDVEAMNKRFDYYTDLQSYGSKIRLQLYPLEKFYFDNQIRCYYPFCRKGNYSHILILSIVAALLLIVGTFNFVNIYTVLMLKRAREYGMKKVFGASSKQTATQIYIENLFMTAIALFVAWILIELSQGVVHSLLGMPLISNNSFNILLSLGIVLLLPAITSFYPFIRYNYSPPITSLRTVNQSGGSVISRSIFLGLQYTITIMLIVVSCFFIKQLNFMLNADPGYRTKNIIKAQLLTDPTSDKARKEAYQKGVLIMQKINESSLFDPFTFGNPPYDQHYTSPIRVPEGAYEDIVCQGTSEKYFKLFNIQLKEGRLWDKEIDQSTNHVIINETAQKLFNIRNLDNAILEKERPFVIYSIEDLDKIARYKIIGIVKDHNTGHLSKATQPMMYYYGGDDPRNPFMAGIPSGKEQEAISFLKQLHEKVNGAEFEYTFISDEIRNLYNKDKQVTGIYTVFAIIAIIISSLGLFSLSLFDIQQRYKEIAIRKVNGATTPAIVAMLLRNYYKLLGIAFLVATPLSWLAITKYLENFANKAPLSWWIFAVAFLITTGISLLTLIWQIRKAAQTNPAKAIKTE